MKVTAAILLFLFIAVPLEAKDIFYDQVRGSDSNSGIDMKSAVQTRTKAESLFAAGDRIWSIGFNFKILAAWDPADPYFGAPSAQTPAATKDVTIILRQGQPLTTVRISRRKTNQSNTLACTADRDTTWIWNVQP